MAPRSIAEEVGTIRADLDTVVTTVGEMGRQIAGHQIRSEERYVAILSAIAGLRDDVGRVDADSRASQIQAARVGGATSLARYLLPLVLGLGGGAGGIELARGLLTATPAQAEAAPPP